MTAPSPLENPLIRRVFTTEQAYRKALQKAALAKLHKADFYDEADKAYEDFCKAVYDLAEGREAA